MKTRLFIDTNIMLDLLGERMPYYIPAAKLATLADQGEIILVASALSYSTVFYLLSKCDGIEQLKTKLRNFRILSEVADVGSDVIEKGLNADFSDFEDSLQYFCATSAACDILVTRNQKDFKNSAIPVMSAEEYLASIGKK